MNSTFRKLRLVLATVICCFVFMQSYAQLNTGDIAFTAFNADGQDDFAIVALADIPANTTIYFTDNEPIAGGGVNSGEGFVNWVSGPTIISAGTVITFTDVSSSTVLTSSVGTLTDGAGSLNLSADGDALFAYLGTSETSPTTWLAGIENEVNNDGGFLADAGLTLGTTFINFAISGSPDGGDYNGPRAGEVNFSDYLALLANSSNWTTNTADGEALLPHDATVFAILATTPEIKLFDGVDSVACGASGTDIFDGDSVSTASGSSSIPVTISNIGTDILVVSGWSIGGTHSTDFTNDPGNPATPFGIAPGKDTVINIIFNPSADGSRVATLTILSDDTDEASCIVPLNGTGISPEIDVLDGANPVSCGVTGSGTLNAGFVNTILGSAPITVTISNTGTDTLVIFGLVIGGTHMADFTLDGSVPPTPFAILPGASQNIVINFDPAADGARDAVLTITSDDGDESTCMVPLNGTGFTPSELSVLATCTGINLPTEENMFHVQILNLNPGKTYQFDINNDGTPDVTGVTGVTLWTTAGQTGWPMTFIDGTASDTIGVDTTNNGVINQSFIAHEVLCTDIDGDNIVDNNASLCNTSTLPEGEIIAQAAPYNGNNVYKYILTDANGIVFNPIVANYSGHFTNLFNGDYKVYAYNFADTVDANTFCDSLIAGATDLDTVTSTLCVGVCGSASYNIDCLPCPIAIANDTDTIMACGGEEIGLMGTLGGAATSGTWVGGLGQFPDGRNDLNGTYIPDETEYGTSFPLLLVTDDPAGICPADTDTVILTILMPPLLGPIDPVLACGGSFDLASLTVVDSNSTTGQIFYYDGLPLTTPLASSIVTTSSTYYVLKVTNTTPSCFDTVAVLVTVNPIIDPGASVQNPTCPGDQGIIFLSASGGTPGYSYVWSTGNTTDAFILATAGTYTVTITDAAGCDTTASYTLTDPAAMTITAVLTDPLCNNGTDGSIDITVSNGTGPYNYNWNDGSFFTEDLTNISAGLYGVVVTDANFCTTSATYILNNPPAINITANVTANPCSGDSVAAIDVTVSGGTQILEKATELFISEYGEGSGNNKWVEIYNGTGSPVDLNDYQIWRVSNGGTWPEATINLFGTLNSGSTFLISNSSADTAVTNKSNLTTGTLSHSGDDAIGLAKLGVLIDAVGTDGPDPGTAWDVAGITNGTIEHTLIRKPTVLSPNTNWAVSAGTTTADSEWIVNTQDDFSDIALHSFAPPVASPPYAYLWSTTDTIEDISGLMDGVYTITITDGNGCTKTSSFTVTDPDPIVATCSNDGNVSCNGGNDGAASVNVNNALNFSAGSDFVDVTVTASGLPQGNSPRTIEALVRTTQGSLGNIVSWGRRTTNNRNGFAVRNNVLAFVGENNDHQGLTPINDGNWHHVAITYDGDTMKFYVDGALDLAKYIPSDFNTINDNLRLGTISLPSSGENYIGDLDEVRIWSDVRTAAEIATNANSELIGTESNLLVYYNFNQGIPAGDNTTPPVTALIDNGPNGFTGSLTGFALNGTTSNWVNSQNSGTYTFLWSNGASTAAITGLTAGTYSVIVTDSLGCADTCAVTITEPAALVATCSNDGNVSCNGGNDGVASVSAVGGTLPYTYLWSDPSAQTTGSATNLTAGTYSVIVTDSLGCTDTCEVTITEPDALLLVCNVDANATCNGNSDGAASVTVSGGTTPYSYLWHNGDTTSFTLGLTAGSATVVVTDANGCIDSCTVVITEPAELFATAVFTNVTCNGAADGTASVTPTGGTPPYTYLWDDPLAQATATATGLSGGNYIVTITDSNMCITTVGVFIIEPAPLANAPALVPPFCRGDSTGKITAIITGGTSPYTYLWNTGSATVTVENLSAGQYILTVTDSNNCVLIDTMLLTEPPAWDVSVNPETILCAGDSNANIIVNINAGGTPPYSYLWNTSPAQTTATASNLSAGTYQLIITDSVGCDTVITSTVVEPDPLDLGALTFDAICYNDTSGGILLNVSGGVSPYSYLWNTGDTVNGIGNLLAGSYTVTVTDANNCTITETFIIGQSDSLSITGIVIDALCNGSSDGSVSVTTSGGASPYTYLWSNTATTSTVSGLSAGTYIVTVTDDNSCTKSAEFIVGQPSAVDGILSVTNVSCNAGNDGTITVTPSGGTPGYFYSWSNGATTQTISGLTANSYTVIITDSNGCTKIISGVVNEPPALVCSETITNVLCYGDATGSILVNASGGSPGYTYQWSNGDIGPIADSLSAGTYVLTLTDANGCSKVSSYTITQPTFLTTTSSQHNVSCKGGMDGTANVVVSGGTAPYSYLWNTIPAQTTSFVTGLTVGTYVVIVTDANGCTITDSVIIRDHSALLAFYIPKNPTCNGAADGEIDLLVGGGVAPYSYTWSNGETTEDIIGLTAGIYYVSIVDFNGCASLAIIYLTDLSTVQVSASVMNIGCNGNNSGMASAFATGGTGNYTYLWSDGQFTPTAVGLAIGTYTVTVSDGNGCTASTPVSISQASVLSCNVTQTDTIFCFGDETAKLQATITGGTAPYSYIWNSNPVQTTSVASNLGAGMYSVIITDAFGCNTICSYEVLEPSFISCSTTATDAFCNGDSSGTATVIADGGTFFIQQSQKVVFNVLTDAFPDETYWMVQDNSTLDTLIYYALGTYTQGVDDSTLFSDSLIILAGDTLLFTIFDDVADGITHPGGYSIVIDGDTSVAKTFGSAFVTEEITVLAADTTINYSYLWSNGDTTQTASNLSSGIYTVTLTDLYGCTTTCTVEVDESDPIITNISATNTLCTGDSSGTVTVNATGGTPGVFASLPGNQNSGSLLAGPPFSVLSGGTLGGRPFDDGSCCDYNDPPTDILSFTVDVSGSYTINNDYLPAFNWDGYMLLYTDPLDWTQITPTTFVDGNDDCVFFNTSCITVNLNAGQNYYLVTTGFSDFDNGSWQTTFTGPGNAGLSLGDYLYQWSNGSTTQSVSGLSEGTYFVTVTDANGCTAIDSIVISNPLALQLDTIVSTNVTCKGVADGTAAIGLVTGGNPPYTVEWNTIPIQNTATALGLAPGTYTAIITDANGCTVSDSISVAEPANELVLAIVNVVTVDCAGGNTGSATVSVSGGTAPYSYLWSDGQTNATAINLSGRIYVVTVTDANGCQDLIPVPVTSPFSMNVSITKTDAFCHNDSSGTATANVMGGTAPFAFIWLNSNNDTIGTGTSIDSLLSGAYTVIVTDNSGCMAMNSFNIYQPSPAVQYTSVSGVTCNGGNDGAATSVVFAGTPPYTYLWSDGQTTVTAVNLSAGIYTVAITDGMSCVTIGDTAFVLEPAPVHASAVVNQIQCFGGYTGMISLVTTGGTAPYQYDWNTGQTSAIISSLTTGTYTVTVSDLYGCTFDTSFTIVQPDSISCTSSVIMPSCNGLNDGTITIDSTWGGTPAGGGPTGPIQAYFENFESGNGGWTAGGTSSSWAYGAPAGADINTAYSGTNAWVTSLTGLYNNNEDSWIQSPSVDLTGLFPTVVSFQINYEAETSWDGAQLQSSIDGGASWQQVGAFGDPTNWYNDNSINGSGAGWNSQDGWSGRFGSGSNGWVQVSHDISSLAGASNLAFRIAFGSDGSVNDDGVAIDDFEVTAMPSLTVGPNAGFMYTWSNGQNGPTATGLTAGNWFVTITDSTGCSITKCIKVGEPPALLCASSVTDLSCYGDSSGAVDLTVSGGTVFSTPPPVQVSAYFEDFEAGSGGWVSSGFNNSWAYGTPAGVDITAAYSGANAWVTNLTGSYNNNEDSWVESPSIDLTPYIGLVSVSFQINYESEFSWDGAQLQSTVDGGTTWQQVGSLGDPTNWYNDNSINGAGAGWTTQEGWTGRFGSGSNGWIQVSHDISSLTGASAVAFRVAFGSDGSGNDDGVAFDDFEVIALAAGTAVSPYTYAWSNGATTQDISGINAGNYTVTITDGNGCTTSCMTQVSQPDSISFGKVITNATCGLANGTVSILATGGTEPYSYLWSNGQTTANATGLLAGSYSIIITDANGCVGLGTCVIGESPIVECIISGFSEPSCNGYSDGFATVQVTAGTGPYTYLWNSSPVQTSQTAINLPAGNYAVTVTDSLGCISTCNVTLGQPEPLTYNIQYGSNVCSGTSTGSATAAVSGGTIPYSYLWSDGQTLATATGLITGTYFVTVTDVNGCSTIGQATIQTAQPISCNTSTVNSICGQANGIASVYVYNAVNPVTYLWSDGQDSSTAINLLAGIYTVTVTDANGCTTECFATVNTQGELISWDIGIDVSCQGGSDGSANILLASGGTAPYSYLWSNGETNSLITGLSAGTYAFTITDTLGCMLMDSIDISEPDSISISISSTNITCIGYNNGTALASATGGTAPYIYTWSNGQGLTNISNLHAGIYTVTVVDVNGCSASAQTIVLEGDSISCTFNVVDPALCEEPTGEVEIFPTGGTAPYSYVWATTPIQTTSTAFNLPGGSVFVTITDANGCSKTECIKVPVANGPQYSVVNSVFSGGYNISCNGASDGTIDVILLSGGPVSYSWSNGATTSSLTGLVAGTYTVEIGNTNCVIVHTIVLTEPSPLTVQASSYDVTCAGNNNGIALVNAYGGTAPYSYTWNTTPAQFTAVLTGLGAGLYDVEVADANGCTQTTQTTINESNTALVVTQSVTSVTCKDATDGAIDVTVSGGTMPYSYQWNDGTTVEDRTGLDAGVYKLTITDALGCNVILCAVVSEPSQLVVGVNGVGVSSAGGNDGHATAIPSGGSHPYTYIWSNGATTQMILGLTSGVYTVTLVDANGCTATQSVEIFEPSSSLITGGTGIVSALIKAKVYPNPTNGMFSLEIESNKSERIYVDLFDLKGRMISTDVMNITEGVSIKEYNLETADRGIYLVRIYSDAEFKDVIRVVLQ